MNAVDVRAVALPQPARFPLGWLTSWWRSPWRKPRILEALTWVYLAWSILPVAIAVLYSFNAGRSRSVWQGFSLRWYFTDPVYSVWHDPDLHAALFQSVRLAVFTTLIAVPLGVVFAIGIDRWHGRLPQFFNFQMLVSFVLPEIILGVALLFMVTHVLTFIPLGTYGQVVALVTFQVSFPVIIVRARMLSIGAEYEEAAMDLGATPFGAVRRVLLPMLYPAIFVSAVLVFADVIDDFVIVRALSSDVTTEPMSVKIYNSARSSPSPALNAIATIMLVLSFLAVAIGVLVYRRMTRIEGSDTSALDEIAMQL